MGSDRVHYSLLQRPPPTNEEGDVSLVAIAQRMQPSPRARQVLEGRHTDASAVFAVQ
jgi:hypothetical protein